MSDKYVRVAADRPSDRPSYIRKPLGPLMVVPANAIVVERPLPEVRVEPRYIEADGVSFDLGCDRAWLRRRAAAFLAMAEWSDEHPPVDEREVEALTKILANVGDGGIFEELDRTASKAVAQALLATGRVHVDTEDGVK